MSVKKAKVTEIKRRTLRPILMNVSKGRVIQLNVVELGVENIKEIFTVAIETSLQVVDLAKDFDWQKMVALGFDLVSFRTLEPIAKQALAEFKEGITSAEAKELADHFNREFDIPNDELEAKIEAIINLVPMTYEWIDGGKDLVLKWSGALKNIGLIKTKAA